MNNEEQDKIKVGDKCWLGGVIHVKVEYLSNNGEVAYVRDSNDRMFKVRTERLSLR